MLCSSGWLNQHKQCAVDIVCRGKKSSDTSVTGPKSAEARAAALGLLPSDLTPYMRAVKLETSLAKEAKFPAILTKDESEDIRTRVLNLWKEPSYREKFLFGGKVVADKQRRKDAIEAKFKRVRAKQLYFERKQEATKVSAFNYRMKRYRSILQKMHMVKVQVARGLPKDTTIRELLGPELWYEEKQRMLPDITNPEELLSHSDLEKALHKKWANTNYTQEDLDFLESGAPYWVDLDDQRIHAHRQQVREKLTMGYYWKRAVVQRVEAERQERLRRNITTPSEEEIYLKEGDDGYHYKYTLYSGYNKAMCDLFNPKPFTPKNPAMAYDIHIYDDDANRIIYSPKEFLLYKARTQPYNRMMHGKYELIDDMYHFETPYKKEEIGEEPRW